MRIVDLLAARRIDFEPLPHPPAYTAQKLAKYLHEEELAKIDVPGVERPAGEEEA